MRIPRERPIRLGAIAGIGIGTIGLAAEWAWSYVWWELPWTASMLPEAAIMAFIMAVAGGVIGGFIGRALASPWVTPVSRPPVLVPVAVAAAVAVFIYAAPISEGDPVTATVELRDVTPAPERTAHATIRVDPADAADQARWFTMTSWQGGGSHVDRLEEVSPGVWRTTKPVPLYGNWKTTLRLHDGSAVLGAAVYFPEDTAIPAPAVEAPPTFTRSFQEDKKLLQREQKSDVSPILTTGAYVFVLMIALGLVASLAKGLRRLDHTSEQMRMKAGGETHETKVGARFARSADGRDGNGDGDGSEAKAKSGTGSGSDSG
jgi:hypothetical protein